MSEPAIKGRWNGANGILEKRETVVEFGGVESCCAHENILRGSVRKHEKIEALGRAYGMTVDILGYRVDYNVRAMVQWVLNIWAQEGIIDHNHNAVTMCHGGDFTDVHQG